MITFKQFLSESSDFEISTVAKLERYMAQNCKRACEVFRDHGVLFYRGAQKSLGTDEIEDFQSRYTLWVGTASPRKDRTPRDTPQFVHDYIDDWFNDKYGFKARSQGLFVVGDANDAQGYGVVAVILPIGDFTTYSSPQVDDMTHTLFPDHDWSSTPGPVGGYGVWNGSDPSEEDQIALLDQMLDRFKYVKDDFETIAKHKHMEVMIDCKKYLMMFTGDYLQIREMMTRVANGEVSDD